MKCCVFYDERHQGATRANRSDQQHVSDVRETLEYKKALELQIWLEEQQAFYKGQVRSTLLITLFVSIVWCDFHRYFVCSV